jgi:drug/metabolite transporter (DMT)-like permease
MAVGDWLMLALLSILWGTSFLFYKVLADELPAMTTALARVGLAGALLALFLPLRGTELRIPRALWPKFVVLAALNNAIPFTLLAWGETRVSSGTASILVAATPVFTVLVTGLVLRSEALTVPRIVGCVCGLTGVAVLVGPDALVGQDLLGQAACLGAAIAYGFGGPYGRRIAGIEPPRMAFGQLTAASVIMLPIELMVDRPWTLPAPSAAGWVALVGIAVLSTSVAYLLFFRILERAGPTNLSLVALMVPATALLLGSVVLGEQITASSVAGMGLIAAGLIATDGRVFRKRVQSKQDSEHARQPRP